MSTLLKKKYCQERPSTSTRDDCVCKDDESNDTSLSTSEQRSDDVITSTAVPIPVSPVSVTVTNDDDRSHSSIVPSDDTECTDVTSVTSRKSVRFSDVHQVLIDNEYSEKVHEYRTDIWYTREEYRTFWNDRMHSIRLWKCLFDENDVRSNGVLGTYSDFRWEGKDFTVRGLENYIFSSSGEMNRQRDLYNVAVLQAPYDAASMLAQVCDVSLASLQRAQNYALHDAVDSYENCASAPISHQIRNRSRRFQCSSTPPRSPSSILSPDTFHQSVETMNDPRVDITSVREMNKRLIKKHLNDSAYHDLSPVQKKMKRRLSSSGSYVLAHNFTYPERRRSTSFLSKDCRHPVSLQIHNTPSIDRQRRRPSMADDFNQHMQFCNRLLNDLPIVDHCPYRRDSLSLAGSGLNKVPDQLESIAGYNDHGYMGIDDEYLMQRQIRRDSLCGSQRGLFAGIDPDILTSSISAVPVHAMKPPKEVFDNDDRSLLHRMLLERKQKSLNDSTLNEYTSYIRSYSRLRRDSLGGNFGM